MVSTCYIDKVDLYDGFLIITLATGRIYVSKDDADIKKEFEKIKNNMICYYE